MVDRVEDGAVGGGRVDDLGAAVEQRRNALGDAAHQGDLDEDQRLVGQGRVEEGEAAAILRQPPPQIVPAVDRMHRLVVDQLLEHDRGRAPVDALEHQETAVEPGAEQVQEIGVDRAP